MKTVKVMISPFYNGGPWTDKKSGVGFHPKRDFGKVMKINAEDISGIESAIRYNRLLPIEGFETNVPTPPAPPVNPEFIGTKATSDYLALSFDRPVFPVAGRTITLLVDGVERTLLAESGDLKGHVIGYKATLGKTYALSVNEGVFVDKNNYTVSSFQVTEKGITEKPVIVDPTGITVSPKTITPNEGQTGTITATVAPDNATDKKVTWTSSAPTIITVDATGKWTAVKAGTATLTAKTVNDLQDTVSVTVKAPVTGVTASPKTVTGAPGAKAKVSATVAPANATNKAVTWTSDKPAVATITNTGDYTLVAEGTATFTVKTTDGAKTDTVAVTVTAPPTEPEVKVASAPAKKRTAKKKVEETE